MNNKGQFFSLFMVFITLAMVMFVSGLYFIQQDDVAVSLISPLAVLELRDDLDVFEMKEEELILESLESVVSEFGTDEFVVEFRETFFTGLSEEMDSFLISDLIWDRKNLELSNGNRETFFRNIIYPKVSTESFQMRFVRGNIGKSRILSAGDDKVVNFPVEFEFEFEQEYLIREKGSSFSVEVVE